MLTDPSIPPLRVKEFDGDPNVIPVFEMVFSGATVTKTGPAQVTIGGFSTGAGTVYAGTGNSYVVLSAAADLTAERVLTASSGIGITDNGANSTVLVSANTNVRDKEVGVYFAGALATTSLAINTRIYIPFNLQLLQVRLAAQTGPTGESIIINPLQYDATLAASTAIFASTNRPLIVATAKVGSDNGTFALSSLYAGSWLGVNLDQVGANIAGSNLTVTFVVRSS